MSVSVRSSLLVGVDESVKDPKVELESTCLAHDWAPAPDDTSVGHAYHENGEFELTTYLRDT